MPHILVYLIVVSVYRNFTHSTNFCRGYCDFRTGKVETNGHYIVESYQSLDVGVTEEDYASCSVVTPAVRMVAGSSGIRELYPCPISSYGWGVEHTYTYILWIYTCAYFVFIRVLILHFHAFLFYTSTCAYITSTRVSTMYVCWY